MNNTDKYAVLAFAQAVKLTDRVITNMCREAHNAK